MTTAVVDDTDFEEAWKAVVEAQQPSDLFAADPQRAKGTYRRLAQALHPDHTQDPKAPGAFARLKAMWEAYTTGGAGPAPTVVHISTNRRTYVVGDLLASGDLSNVYIAAFSEGGTNTDAVLKMSRNPRNSDLMRNEATALKQLRDNGDRTYAAYVPDLLDSFRHKDVATGVERHVNVLNLLDGFYTLTEVRDHYEDGINERDAAWMWRRLLVALGYAHRAGVIHGAVIPDNVMIHPALHGLVLVDWCFSSVEEGRALVATVPRYPDIYPPVTMWRTTGGSGTKTIVPATPGLDVYMATKTMEWMLDDHASSQIRAFIKGCTLDRPSTWPSDAWGLQSEYDELIERLYGPRKFRPFAMPERVHPRLTTQQKGA